MGTDCTMVVEMIDKAFESHEYWEIVGVIHLNRDYKLFDKISEKAIGGYPPNCNWLTNKILEDNESWGECWMSMEDFANMKQAKKHEEWNVFKKKLHKDMRCIFRFDN